MVITSHKWRCGFICGVPNITYGVMENIVILVSSLLQVNQVTRSVLGLGLEGLGPWSWL